MPLRDNACNYYAYLIANNQGESDHKLTHDIRGCKNRGKNEYCHDHIPPIFLQSRYLNKTELNRKDNNERNFKGYPQYER